MKDQCILIALRIEQKTTNTGKNDSRCCNIFENAVGFGAFSKTSKKPIFLELIKIE